MNKYNYYKVIQGDYGYGWSDEDFHPTDSQGNFRSGVDRATFKENLKAYHENGGGVYRVIKRRELKS
jgi:hypothetical protein